MSPNKLDQNVIHWIVETLVSKNAQESRETLQSDSRNYFQNMFTEHQKKALPLLTKAQVLCIWNTMEDYGYVPTRKISKSTTKANIITQLERWLDAPSVRQQIIHHQQRKTKSGTGDSTSSSPPTTRASASASAASANRNRSSKSKTTSSSTRPSSSSSSSSKKRKATPTSSATTVNPSHWIPPSNGISPPMMMNNSNYHHHHNPMMMYAGNGSYYMDGNMMMMQQQQQQQQQQQYPSSSFPMAAMPPPQQPQQQIHGTTPNNFMMMSPYGGPPGSTAGITPTARTPYPSMLAYQQQQQYSAPSRTTQQTTMANTFQYTTTNLATAKKTPKSSSLPSSSSSRSKTPKSSHSKSSSKRQSTSSNTNRETTTTMAVPQAPAAVTAAPAAAAAAAAATTSSSAAQRPTSGHGTMPSFQEMLEYLAGSAYPPSADGQDSDDDRPPNSNYARGSDDSTANNGNGSNWTLIQQLRMAGFTNMAEIQGMIETFRQQNTPITVEGLICAMVQAREDAALARDMDEARRQSELEHQQEQERLKEQRMYEEEQQLLDTSLQELLHPTVAEDRKRFFPRSWMLRHEPIYSWLESIWNDTQQLPVKKGMIQLLKLEKNAFKWYSNGIPKTYFTFGIGKRVLNCKNDISTLEQELNAISLELQEGTALPSKQNKDRVPLIFVNALEEYKEEYGEKSRENSNGTDNHSAEDSDDDDDDDDDIRVLGEEEIRKLQQQKVNGRRTNTATAAMTASAAIEVEDN